MFSLNKYRFDERIVRFVYYFILMIQIDVLLTISVRYLDSYHPTGGEAELSIMNATLEV